MQHRHCGEQGPDISNSHTESRPVVVEEVEFSGYDETVDDRDGDISDANSIEVGSAAIDDTRNQDGSHIGHNWQ